MHAAADLAHVEFRSHGLELPRLVLDRLLVDLQLLGHLGTRLARQNRLYERNGQQMRGA